VGPLHVQASRSFLYALSVAVAGSCSDDSAISYVLPVLWMTSCVCIMCQINTDTGLDRLWMDQDVKYDFTADLTGTGDRSVNVITET